MFLKPNVVEPGLSKSALRAPAFILIVGLLSLVLLVTTDWIRERLVAVEMVRLHSLVELQLAASTVHLWLEEYVSGDEVDLTEISDSLERAAHLCKILIEGGHISDTNIDLLPMQYGPALQSALQVRNHLETFSGLTSSRLAAIQRHENAGIGSPMDREYDSSYRTFLSAARNVESVTRNKLTQRTRLARVLYLAILLLWTATILTAVTVLRTHEHRQRVAEEKLRRKEAQLAQSQKMDAVGRLASGITHDINNYVAAINSNCELLKIKNSSDSAVTQKMNTVLAVTGKISALNERLMAFASRQPRHRKIININVLIADFKSMLQTLIGKNIQLTLDFQSELWPIYIDPGQIEQLVMNLTVNSWQAMPSGGQITITTGNVTVDEYRPSESGDLVAGDYVVLEVSDNGPGLSPEIQEKVFEPFFTTKDNSKNSGLGLATVYGIVQQNHGHITLFSEPGDGATFRIYFNRHTTTTNEHPAIMQPRIDAQARGKTVLLVDDDDSFRDSIAEWLDLSGYTVIANKNAESAFQDYQDRSSDIDLLITDVIMPGANGPELARWVHSLDADVPVLFMSGYTIETLADRGLLDQRLNILRKPFSAEILSEKIAEALSVNPAS